MLKLLMENPAVKKGAQNGKFDMEWLKVKFNINTQNFAFDTILAHYIAISEEKGTQGLKSQAWEYTDLGGYDNALDTYRDNLSDGEGLESRFNYDRIPWNILREYAAADSDCTMRLWNLYEPLIQNNPKWNILFNDIMLPGTSTLMDVEINGMHIDSDLSSSYKEEYEQERQRIIDRLDDYPEVIQIKNEKLELFKERQQIRLIPKKDRTPEEQRKFVEYKKFEDFKFNWSSVSHLRELLFEKLHLKTDILTDKGELSTSEESLEKMKDQHEIPKLLLELRKINTLNSLFIQKLSTLADSQNLIHSSYNMTGCIIGDSLILTSEGLQYIKSFINESKSGEFVDCKIQVVNRYGELEETSQVVKYENQPTIKIETQLGLTLEGTYNHPILTLGYLHHIYSTYTKDKRNEVLYNQSNYSFVELQRLTLDHLIAVPYNQQVFGNTTLTLPKVDNNPQYPSVFNEDFATFLGLYRALGKHNKSTLVFNVNQPDIINLISSLALNLFHTKVIISNNILKVKNPIFEEWQELLQLDKENIPNFILQAPKQIQIAYIRGLLYKSNVVFRDDSAYVKYYTSSLEEITQLQLMLLNLGIISSLTIYNSKGKAKYLESSRTSNSYYILISGDEFCRCRDTIGIWKHVDFSYKNKSPNKYIVDYSNNIMWLRIKNIQKRYNDVYDFVVPSTHSFISNSFISHNTVTGRLSSENPNLQQIPRKSPENPLLFQYHHEPKALFTSRFGEDGVIMNADYSALEMRIAAVISNDKKMSQAFLSGIDIHKSNAAYMYKIPIEEVTKDLRTLAKSLGFGILYGKSGVTFAKDLYFDPTGTTPGKTADWEEAKRLGFDIIDHFLGTFKGVRKWLKDTKEFAYENGYVETMFGRRRRLPDLRSKIPRIRADAERQAINAPIQGTGSDFTMLSLIHINDWIKQNKLKSLIVATVHDSIVFDVYLPELPILATQVKQIMESVHKPYINTIIPIVSELELGRNYGSIFEVELSDITNISNKQNFSNWEHEHNLAKYQKEISFFYKLNWSYKDVIIWLQDNNRPLKELKDFIIQTYS